MYVYIGSVPESLSTVAIIECSTINLSENENYYRATNVFLGISVIVAKRHPVGKMLMELVQAKAWDKLQHVMKEILISKAEPKILITQAAEEKNHAFLEGRRYQASIINNAIDPERIIYEDRYKT